MSTASAISAATSHQKPVRQRLMKPDVVHAVDDVADNDADADGQKRNNDADGNVPENNRRPRFPNKMEHRRNVLKRRAHGRTMRHGLISARRELAMVNRRQAFRIAFLGTSYPSWCHCLTRRLATGGTYVVFVNQGDDGKELFRRSVGGGVLVSMPDKMQCR